MYPGHWAEQAPTRAAVVLASSGTIVTYAELDARSNQLAQHLRRIGLVQGDVVAAFLPNDEHFHVVAWAVRRSGMYLTPVNCHLTLEEVAYIVDDSKARVLIASAAFGDVAEHLGPEVLALVEERLMIGGTRPGWRSYEEVVAGEPETRLPDEAEGTILQYSSGTTGKPKGVARAIDGGPMRLEADPTVPFMRAVGFGEGDVYLSPAPLYHSAPAFWTMAVHRLGGTVVVMERFDPEQFLMLIERYGVTHTQAVPTMFVRLLKMPAEVRKQFDLSSLRCVVHAAAPCPVPVKHQIIEWLGPIVSEFWSSTEGAGATFVTAAEWLAHPGTVGRPMIGALHILDDDGNEVPTGETGQIWAEGGPEFEYLNDTAKTAGTRNDRGWRTVGDIGHIDADGYLYLTDRKAYMIISGGVNIYPQEAESVLVTHPRVMDVAVFGVPNDEMGEQVKAVVQPVDWAEAGPTLEQDLIAFCREHLAGYKCPRSVDFRRELPRTDAGKLYKRRLREDYWERSRH